MSTAAGPRSSRAASWPWRVIAAAVLAATTVGAIAVVALPERMAWLGTGRTTCPFKVATGLRCPFCGMTRATLHLGRGDFAGALRLHPLAPLVLAVVVGGAIVWLASVALGRPLPRWLRLRWQFAVPFGIVVWIANLIWGTG